MSQTPFAKLRDIVPLRPLTRQEALSIAERQALQLLAILRITSAPVSERLLAELPRVQVDRISPFPFSGATHWVNGRWMILLNAAEPTVRQRFSLAHELKHVIDHPFVEVMYSGMRDRDERHDWIEQVCDYFAGCLLMPRPWLKRAWTTDSQQLPDLARRFNVSQAAMNTRLNQTGIREPNVRCLRPPKDWAARAIRSRGGTTYHRTPAPLLTI